MSIVLYLRCGPCDTVYTMNTTTTRTRDQLLSTLEDFRGIRDETIGYILTCDNSADRFRLHRDLVSIRLVITETQQELSDLEG